MAQPVDAGVPVCALAFAADQVARGWQVSVAAPSDGLVAREATGVGAIHVPWEATRAPGPSVLGEAAALRRAVRAVRPQVIHLHSAKAGLVGRLVVRGRTPTLFQPHAWSFQAAGGPVAAAAAAWERFAARWASVVVCVSEAERAEGEAAGIRARYAVVRNGVDVDRYAPADRSAARARLGLSPEAPLAVCVGRLARQKGQDVLLHAWPAVRAAVPAAELVLVGDGPDRADLESRAPAGARLVGARSDVADWLAAADVAVLPSRWEGLSLALLEALASGRGVVASDVAGMAEAIGADAGAVVPPEDPAALSAALAARLGDRARAAREGEAARARALAHFDLRRQTETIAALTARLAAGQPSA